MSASKVEKWIDKNNLGPGAIDIAKTVKLFTSEMEKGLTPAGSSLPMIPTYVETDTRPPVNVSAISIDSGGSNLRIASIRFDARSKASIESFEAYPVPGKTEQVTIDDYFDYLAERIAPIAKGKDRIGYCFSFPAKILPSKDGSILHFDKEIKVTGGEGRLLGAGLLSALSKRGVTNLKKVVVVNDTVATALGGRAQMSGMHHSGYFGLILGTGLNICYPEQKMNITKEPSVAEQGGTMLVNIESGFFDKMTRGPIDKELDAASREPGKSQMEKMIAGAYIGQIFRHSVKKATEEGILEGFLSDRIEGAGTIEMSKFIADPYVGMYSDACMSEEDREGAWKIATSIVERAAKLVTVMVLSAGLKYGEGSNPMQPIYVAGEGATLHKMKGLRENVVHYIRQYSDTYKNVYVDLGSAENAVVYGCAMAAYL